MNENNNSLCTTTLGDKENTAAHARSAAAGASHVQMGALLGQSVSFDVQLDHVVAV